MRPSARADETRKAPTATGSTGPRGSPAPGSPASGKFSPPSGTSYGRNAENGASGTGGVRLLTLGSVRFGKRETTRARGWTRPVEPGLVCSSTARSLTSAAFEIGDGGPLICPCGDTTLRRVTITVYQYTPSSPTVSRSAVSGPFATSLNELNGGGASAFLVVARYSVYAVTSGSEALSHSTEMVSAVLATMRGAARAFGGLSTRMSRRCEVRMCESRPSGRTPHAIATTRS